MELSLSAAAPRFHFHATLSNINHGTRTVVLDRPYLDKFVDEGHLRWDSLGEFCALVASFEHVGEVFNNDNARLLAETLDQAVGQHLEYSRNPSRRVKELDTRGSHFYLALYWAEALANQTKDSALKAKFTPIYQQLSENQDKIVEELNNESQGKAIDIGGYYLPHEELAAQAMRPSSTLNRVIDSL